MCPAGTPRHATDNAVKTHCEHYVTLRNYRGLCPKLIVHFSWCKIVLYKTFYMTLINLNTNSAQYDRSMENYSCVALYERMQFT